MFVKQEKTHCVETPLKLCYNLNIGDGYEG